MIKALQFLFYSILLLTISSFNAAHAQVLVDSRMSGTWFDPAHDGEGFMLEVLEGNRAFVYWFTYDEDGGQRWFFGGGDIVNDTLEVDKMMVSSGAIFGEQFEPDDVIYEEAGGLTIKWADCSTATATYTINGIDGNQALTRLTSVGNPQCDAEAPPNILLVIADDLGLDASNQYDISAERPITPGLDRLATEGLVFENAWSNPTCSPTRAGILTGKYGTRTGVLIPTDVLSEDETSLQTYIHQHLPGKYTDAVIGKWHLGPQPGGLDHPSSLGIGHFSGIIGGGVDDYEEWVLTTDGQRSNETEYVTSKLVDLAVEWTGAQQSPWFLWLAFNAPHTPFHLPPANLHSRQLSGTEADIQADPLPYYFAAIEAMDSELDRLLDSFDEQTRANTIVIFIGDNGTPGQVAQSPYSRQKAKGSLYQGGVNVPFFVSGPGVTRINERETALINTTDLFSTIAALAGVNVDQINDSTSFENLLSVEQSSERFIQYSEQSTDTGEEWAVSDGIYKLIETSAGAQQLFQLSSDPFEETDMVSAGTAPTDVVDDLRYLAEQIRNGQ